MKKEILDRVKVEIIRLEEAGRMGEADALKVAYYDIGEMLEDIEGMEEDDSRGVEDDCEDDEELSCDCAGCRAAMMQTTAKLAAKLAAYKGTECVR